MELSDFSPITGHRRDCKNDRACSCATELYGLAIDGRVIADRLRPENGPPQPSGAWLRAGTGYGKHPQDVFYLDGGCESIDLTQVEDGALFALARSLSRAARKFRKELDRRLTEEM